MEPLICCLCEEWSDDLYESNYGWICEDCLQDIVEEEEDA